MTEHAYGPTGAGTVMLDLGPDTGALVLYTPADLVGSEIEIRKALSLVAHRCKEILVKVQYEHRTEHHHFPPSATVFRVLQWAIGKLGLDDISRAKAHLMLPGSAEPLPNDAVLGRLVKFEHHEHRHELVLDLTLKDFTNG